MVSGNVTLLLLALFLGAWVWAWSPRRKAEFDAAARLPLDDKPASEASAEENDR
jgi:cytochrome c oxidase cbb3-type subunit 4